MKKGITKPKPIPTTRNWYKSFKEIMNDKIERLEQLTWQSWGWTYDEYLKLPFRLWQGNNFDACFSTDWELFECVFWMIWGIEFAK